MRAWRQLALIAALAFGLTDGARAEREPVLKQVDLPHSYYWRELYIPQLTTGPSSVAFEPDGKTLIYSMGGSLWRQAIGSEEATELTHPRAAYDYQPDVSPDGRSVLFSRYDGTGLEVWRLDLASGREQRLTSGGAVNVEPRISPDGKRIAWVSTTGTGHFNLFVADLGPGGLTNSRPLLGERQSKIARYYYSTFDHALNPSWTPDGKRILYVTNDEVAWGTGDIWSVAVDDPADRRRILSEETSWSARPEMSPDGKQVLFASYHGRQWRQLWLTTPEGAAALPLTFGEFDLSSARWSPDGERIAYISNESGNTSLAVRDYYGGQTVQVIPKSRRFKSPQARFVIDIRDEHGASVPARVAVIGSDGRAIASVNGWMHADDGFDRKLQAAETHYFHCPGRCVLEAPAGKTTVWVQRGFRYLPWQESVELKAGSEELLSARLELNDLPTAFGKFRSADLHVHMNYGGAYRNTPANLTAQARSEDLDAVYNLIVNKEERIPDIGIPVGRDPASTPGTLIMHSQEFHTSYWGHLGLLGLSDHVLTPDFSAYRHTALASPYPYNGKVSDLAHAQGALVGYVHPYDWVIDPAREKSLSNELPADVINNKVDYIEIVGFSDHKSTANIWYRLLNLGFRIPAGAGTDAMANYASLRGPVGMNRVFLDTGGELSPEALEAALKAGRTFASNGPMLGFELEGKRPGGTVAIPGPGVMHYRVALRSPASVDHLELVQNGKVVKAFTLGGDRRKSDFEGELKISEGGWIVLRAWNDGSDPQVLDLYPYATTSPIYFELPGGAPRAPADALYFSAWLDRVIADAESRTDFRNDRERNETLSYLRDAKSKFEALAK
ncbi:CehA/McbA family metallohydrolase [Sphingomonas daechungensis]|uniref:CehA/McbA family metallohydrolase n=1 Tax=Sphingomonas daechungensis TaxID=1176646 RepID=UPI0037849BB0